MTFDDEAGKKAGVGVTGESGGVCRLPPLFLQPGDFS